MPTRIGINGFGRMGRLALRADGDGLIFNLFTVRQRIGYVNRMIELAQKVAASL